ncbi:MAG: cytochrome c oxidase subunit 3 [Novosphingobium sp.]|nr:cytochrome c oxidase subunit 3 [Novosphingobium sp.]
MHQTEVVPAPEGGVRRERAPAIWIFIAMDCTSFGVLFLVFMYERMGQVALFDEASHLLNAPLGFFNACVLITSSWLVAWANIVGREGRFDEARRLMLAGMAVASIFLIVKVIEYYMKLSVGITVKTNAFFLFYYALTGVHLMHYLGGMVILAILAQGPSPYLPAAEAKASYLRWLEGGSLYWHMVDLLWIFIFSILYLIGAR